MCSPKIKSNKEIQVLEYGVIEMGTQLITLGMGSFSLTIACSSFNSIIHCNSAHSIDSWNGNDMNVVEKRKGAKRKKNAPIMTLGKYLTLAMMKTCVKN
jgi:hypothetical protein